MTSNPSCLFWEAWLVVCSGVAQINARLKASGPILLAVFRLHDFAFTGLETDAKGGVDNSHTVRRAEAAGGRRDGGDGIFMHCAADGELMRNGSPTTCTCRTHGLGVKLKHADDFDGG